MSERIEIFLPVRNGGAHLSEAIDSILAQDDPDWRLVILDNRSSDDTIARVKAVKDDRVTLHEAIEALSITGSWQRILPFAATLPADRLMSLIGHDDLLAPHFVGTIKRLADEDPLATLYQTQLELIDGAGRLVRPARPVPLREEDGDLLAALCWGIRDSFGTGYAFRAGDYVRVGGIPTLPRLLYADHLLFARLTALAHKRSADVVGCSYRLHLGSASNGISPERLADHASALDRFVDAIAAEFADFERSDRGRIAVGELLARELLILEAPGLTRALPPSARQAINRLRTRRVALTGRSGIDRMVDSRPSFPDRARQWSVALRLLRHHLGPRR